jgi:putative hydrolase of the HAD superfamily
MYRLYNTFGMINTIFFDLDDTLYPNASGLWQAIRVRIGLYMEERLNLPQADIPGLRRFYFERYGTTLRGLQIHQQVDPLDYLAYVHDLPLQDYLTPSPQLRQMLLSLPQHRWIFTNADAAHAGRVLEALNLLDCFQGIIDILAMEFACKPEREAFEIALRIAGEPDPPGCMLIDDSPRNLLAAQNMGFATVLVGSEDSDLNSMLRVPDLQSLRSLVPELWSRNGSANEYST